MRKSTEQKTMRTYSKPLPNGPTFGCKICLAWYAQRKQTDLPGRLLWKGNVPRSKGPGYSESCTLYNSLSTITSLIFRLPCPSWVLAKKLSWENAMPAFSDAGHRLSAWFMFDISIRQLGLCDGLCMCSDKNTLLITVPQLWNSYFFSFMFIGF